MAYNKKGKMYLSLNKQKLASQILFMDCEERGAYFSLLVYQGEHGHIPRSSEEMCKICAIPRDALVKMWPKLKQFLDNSGDDKLHFPWLTEEMEHAQKLSDRRSSAGISGSENRWTRDTTVTMDNKTPNFAIHFVIPNSGLFSDNTVTIDNKTYGFAIRFVIVLLSPLLSVEFDRIRIVSYTDTNGAILPVNSDFFILEKKWRGKVGTYRYYNIENLVSNKGISIFLKDIDIKYNDGIKNYLDFISKEEIKNLSNKVSAQKKNKPTPSAFDDQFSRKMAALIEQHVHKANFKVKHNPNAIRLLRTSDGVSEEQLEIVYQYFATSRDWKNKYSCVVESLQTFREKFAKIMAEMSRSKETPNLGLKTTKFEVGDKTYDENSKW